MTLGMNCEIKFLKTENREEFSIYKVSAVTIEKSWKLICGKAEIILPRRWFGEKNIKEVFRRGDKVEIYLGYDGNLNHRFTGFIDHVSADIPIKIKLEDAMWKLKQIPVNFSSSKITLKQFVQKIVGDFPVDIDADVSLGAVRFPKVTFGDVLNKLNQEPYSLHSFIRNGKLTIGKPYSDVDDKIPLFDLERNCSDNSLNYLKKEDRLIKVILKAKDFRGKLIKAEFGDENPITKIEETRNYINVEIKDLQKECKRIYESCKVDGFDGKFTTLGLIPLQHGQKIQLQSSLYPDRNGTYYVDGVIESFDKESGYKQEVELGKNAIK